MREPRNNVERASIPEKESDVEKLREDLVEASWRAAGDQGNPDSGRAKWEAFVSQE